MVASTWTITEDIPDQYSAVNGGTPILGHMIVFITGKGYRGSFFISNDQYTAATVKAAAQVKADLVDQVNTLTSETKV